MVQPYTAAMPAANTSVSARASGTEDRPKNDSRVSEINDRNAPIMNTSPCAKLIIPMMPYTIV